MDRRAEAGQLLPAGARVLAGGDTFTQDHQHDATL